jgi:hypothetical protein
MSKFLNTSEFIIMINSRHIKREAGRAGVGIPNFKNFLSLHIFVQSLAEQKHALKISEHTL